MSSASQPSRSMRKSASSSSRMPSLCSRSRLRRQHDRQPRVARRVELRQPRDLIEHLRREPRRRRPAAGSWRSADSDWPRCDRSRPAVKRERRWPSRPISTPNCPANCQRNSCGSRPTRFNLRRLPADVPSARAKTSSISDFAAAGLAQQQSQRAAFFDQKLQAGPAPLPAWRPW